jgi:DNA polymerase
VGEREEILQDVLERAKYYASLSTLGLPPRMTATAVGAPEAMASALAGTDGRPPAAPAEARTSGSVAPHLAVTPSADAAVLLQAVREDIGDCQRCRLSSTRKTIVFGQGNPNARLMFVGEAPGADEDEQGLAFVGKAGQLLTKIIEAIGMRRDDVYIVNVLKCRPPQNRNPEPDEVLSCQPFLERQIDAIRPTVLVGLGKFGAHWLLKTAEPITRLRGRLGQYRGITVMPTYHPAYLLRNPGAKKEVWEDMKVVRALLNEGNG